jgi:hypothetical protein
MFDVNLGAACQEDDHEMVSCFECTNRALLIFSSFSAEFYIFCYLHHLSWINGFGNVMETESEDEAVDMTKDDFFHGKLIL